MHDPRFELVDTRTEYCCDRSPSHCSIPTSGNRFLLFFRVHSIPVPQFHRRELRWTSVSFPQQSFDTVTPSSAEQKQCLTVWIERQFSLYDFRQSVYAAAKIGISGYQIYRNLWIGCKFLQHDFKADRTAVSCSGDTVSGRVTVIPQVSMRIPEEDTGFGGSRDTI